MRLTAVLLSVGCGLLALVLAITAWQSGPGAFEFMGCVGIAFVLGYLVPSIWRQSGPVHEGGDDGHLRVRSTDDTATACEREAERTWTGEAVK